MTMKAGSKSKVIRVSWSTRDPRRVSAAGQVQSFSAATALALVNSVISGNVSGEMFLYSGEVMLFSQLSLRIE